MLKKIVKIIILSPPLFVFSLCAFCATPAHHQETLHRFVFFGDSLSDTGNYPEPANISAPTFKNVNLYVPITNPVPANSYGKGFIPTRKFLNQSIGPQGKINNEEKVLYSINWPLYLIYNSDNHHNQQYLSTWQDHYQHPLKLANSINYAWASALARGDAGDNQCYHENGKYFKGKCTAKSIMTQRAIYLKNTANNAHYDKDTKYAYTMLAIPNLGKQVSLYLSDHTVSIKNNTIFFIYIGANDIGNYLKSNIGKMSLLPFNMLKSKIDAQMQLIASSVKQTIERLNHAYTHKHLTYKIYVLTLPKLSNLYAAQRYIRTPIIGKRLLKSTDYSVATYNHYLKAKLQDMENVVVLDTGHKIDQLALSHTYKNSSQNGTMCIKDKSNDYLNPSLKSNENCTYNNSQESYFSWNNAHFVSRVNKSLAKYLGEFIHQKK
jgi:phospholipase/lecithinase/hemolysin